MVYPLRASIYRVKLFMWLDVPTKYKMSQDPEYWSTVTLPRTLPTVLGVPLPTMMIVRRRRWGPVIGRERRRVRPVIAPPLRAPRPAIQLRSQVKVRTRPKSTTGFSLSKPVPRFKSGYRFSGCRLTSLGDTLTSPLVALLYRSTQPCQTGPPLWVKPT